ncbi:hypothetical protein [Pseudomonas sp. TMW 2.1634]|uniref:hypothetical protein n=1 Tax=Pseudomonas sp. TMW 2.1634 TaxID=1886807 RepID=UPI0013C3E512|nr:hypothetical protein [Pseudomonas sp. TMW 2.1634]
MPAATSPSRRLVNAVIAILVVCSIGALIEGTGCVNIRYSSCNMFVKFFSHIPFYILGALAVSEAISWGLFSRLVRRKT